MPLQVTGYYQSVKGDMVTQGVGDKDCWWQPWPPWRIEPSILVRRAPSCRKHFTCKEAFNAVPFHFGWNISELTIPWRERDKWKGDEMCV